MKSSIFSNAFRRTIGLVVVIVLGLPPGALGQSAQAPVAVTASFMAAEPVAPDTPLEITLSRPLRTGERIAILLGQTDVSGLFSRDGERFSYSAGLQPLPVGNSELTVYLVNSADDWNEITRLPLAVVNKGDSATSEVSSTQAANDVTTPSTDGASVAPGQAAPIGNEEPAKTDAPPASNDAQVTSGEPTAAEGDKGQTEKSGDTAPDTAAEVSESAKTRFFKFLPSFTISLPAQPFQSNFPLDTRPERRATFIDLDMNGSLKTEGKLGRLSTESNFDFAGSSFKEKTLQFGTQGEDAPDIDMSSYLVNVQAGKARFSLGHTSFGGNRHLVSGFSSRGLSVSVPINKRLDITAGILNGTSVLGIGNFFGMSNIRHQMQGVTLGIEMFPKRPNAMRVEVSGFNGYLQGRSNVSEGSIVDAEQSRGAGVRVLTSDRSQRFKLEFGYALSRFFNAQDTTLDPDGNAIALPPVTRSSHYIETTYQALKDIKVARTKNLNLSVGFRYEFVEPLYRSLGASASADKFSNDVSIDASIGEITFQAAHSRSNDNLRDVPSILKSLTRSNRFSAAVPLAALFGSSEKPSALLPRIGYSIDVTHNFGVGIPVNGGFEVDLSTIPDLVNTNQTFGSAWQFKKFNVDYTYNRSFADNRQALTEANDQLGWVHNVSVGVNPTEKLSMTFGFSFDSQRNFELDTLNQTKSANFGLNWTPFKNAALSFEGSQALAGDLARTARNRNINYSGQFSYTFNREKSKFKKIGTQAFVRFADAYIRDRDFINVSDRLTRTRILTAGLTINVF